ncbi:YmaF family protein [Desulfosporosinus sp. I2]|uniref:YmaF family protein n=1 Tax=Desulfosporosinus sp. I2 TaxID=1617025 RepID=UPI001FA80FEE|nr:YmaF family protein [Desulfosporosinus sp. I2]
MTIYHHSQILYIIWEKGGESLYTSDYHVHFYETRTCCAHGHIHCLSGITGNTVPGGGSHVHYYRGVTTFNDGHVHYYAGVSGPAIYLDGGGHTHSYCDTTTIDNGHAHLFRGQTSFADFAHLFNKSY